MLIAFSLLQLTNGILVLLFLFLGFKYLETNWSYKISKPHAWEEAVRLGNVPKKIKKLERFYRDKVRFYTFWLQVRRLKQENIAGAFAEVGVYKGETARILHAIDPSRHFHLFDTFEGFDNKDLEAEKLDTTGLIDFSDTDVESVTTFIGGNENLVFHPGYFPKTTENLPEEKYALVHLDADLYNPTLSGLRYFYPRLSEGGVIIIHDYNHSWEGVTKAVDEFISTIPESLVPLADWQGSVMILKNKHGVS